MARTLVKSLDDLEWAELLPQVDIKQQEEEDLEAVRKFFKDVNLHKPYDLVDLVHTDLVDGAAGVKCPTHNILLTGFIRRTFRHVHALHAAEHHAMTEALRDRDSSSQPRTPLRPVGPHQLQFTPAGVPAVLNGPQTQVWSPMQQQQRQMMGADPGALALSWLLGGGHKVINVDQLKASKLCFKGLGKTATPPQAAFQLLKDHTARAEAQGLKLKFMNADITSDVFLPKHITPDTVGGR
jgi:hypothetical protein